MTDRHEVEALFQVPELRAFQRLSQAGLAQFQVRRCLRAAS